MPALMQGLKTGGGECLSSLIRPVIREISFVFLQLSAKKLHTNITKLLITPHSPVPRRGYCMLCG